MIFFIDILTKLLLSETFIAAFEQQRNGSGSSRTGSGGGGGAKINNSNTIGKKIAKNFLIIICMLV